jgi:hypothetical protein
MLGRFPDAHWGQMRTSNGNFHTEARDVVMGGDPLEARRYFERRVATDGDLLAELLRAGVVERIDEPIQLLTGNDPD